MKQSILFSLFRGWTYSKSCSVRSIYSLRKLLHVTKKTTCSLCHSRRPFSSVVVLSTHINFWPPQLAVAVIGKSCSRTPSDRGTAYSFAVLRLKGGAFYTLIVKHLQCSEEKFTSYFRLSREQFAKVLNLIERNITTKPSNKYPEPISPAQKLVVTTSIRYVLTIK